MKILVFYDNKGGAWWHRTHQLQKNLVPQIQLDILQLYTPFDHTNYDFILLFEEYLIQTVWFVPSHKIIAGSSCSFLANAAYKALDTQKSFGAVYNSQLMYEKYKHFPRVFCCQNGVDADFFTPAKAIPSEVIACWVGDSSSKYGNKGLDIIQSACKKANVPLIFWDKATSTTAQTHEWIRDNIYRKSSVFICASEHEGTPNPALEAMACGLLVISTPVGNMPEIIQNGINGFLVERSIESIAFALQELQKNKTPSMHTQARSFIEDGWTWEKQSQKYAHMFTQLKKEQKNIVESNTIFPRDFSKLALQAFCKGNISKGVYFSSWAFKYSVACKHVRLLRNSLRAKCRNIKTFCKK